MTPKERVYLEGQLRTRKWSDQQGQDRYTTEVVLQGPQSVLTMLDSPQGGNQPQGNGGRAPTHRNQNGFGTQDRSGFQGGYDSDEAPF